jgi:S1-C subfamily serine protease
MRSPRAIQVANLGVIGLAGLAGILCPDSLAQSAPAIFGVDPFIAAVETMKRSVVSVDCVMVHGAEAEILQRAGSAFFTSGAGDFLTAAHVILAMQGDKLLCPAAAITAPRDGWRPEARDEPRVWFPFNTSGCRIDHDSDVAACRLNEDLSGSKLKAWIAPVKFEWSIPSDGTQVAATGFPLSVRDPATVRAAVAAYRIPWQNDKPIPELVLDRAAWPGYSGAPVYLSDGRVIGILIAGGPDETPGMAIARPASSIRELLSEKQKK